MKQAETELMARFAKIDVGAGRTLDVGKRSPDMKHAIEAGMADAWVDIEEMRKRVTSVDSFWSLTMYELRKICSPPIPSTAT
jgi:hypothetical protein